MIHIQENTEGNTSTFKYTIEENHHVTYEENITFTLIIRQIDGRDYFQIYTPKFRPIPETFDFLNYEKERHAYNSKLKSAQALKLLFTFEKILQKELCDFNGIDINNLKHFLKGISPKGSKFELDFKTIRKNETINGYLAVYRSYAKYLNIENPYLFHKNVSSIRIPFRDVDMDYTTDKYTSNEKVPHKTIEVPWYISVEDFDKILLEIRSNHTVLEEILVRVMYQCGLRLGETLGLTSEDLLIEKHNGEYVPVAYIRNRLSDKKYQYAKTCMKVFSEKEYLTDEYNTLNYGYQRVFIPLDLYDLINEYIEITHVNARSLKPDIYYKHSMADTVKDGNNDNYYIFLNTLYKPLSEQIWNIRLRKIFRVAEITVDKKRRVHNLSHRFRHGFAMFHTKHLGYDQLRLKEIMRHRSILSVEQYYKPTISDSIEMKEDFANSLYELIPSLKK